MKHFISGIFFLFISITNWAQTDRVLNLNPLLAPFYHGVASGDPLHDRVIIWTRFTPDTNFTSPVDISWRMALDTSMSQIVQQGVFTSNLSIDYTVKVDVTGLQPDSWYYYEFTYQNQHSIRGRTKTTPVGMKDSLRFAVVSCANFESGYFNAYKAIKERNDIDAVIHLGDYIYEYENGGYAPNAQTGRTFEPLNEITTLYDYRTRYSMYHLDEDLMRLHQQYPFINVWDDHESANDAWMGGAENHDASEGNWSDRKSYSTQAFMEWIPIRQVVNGNNDLIYRRIQYGDLVEFFMLDTRLNGREEQSGTSGSTVTNPSRTLLGADQYAWLTNGMMNSTARWKVLGNQVMFAPLKIFGVGVNGDQWDGYPAERNNIMNHVLNNSIEDVVVITGDIHTSWGNDIPTSNYQSNGSGSAFVEFVTPSVTSPGFPLNVGSSIIQLANNHMKYIDVTEHGFIILDINQNKTQSDWYFVNTLDQSDAQHYRDASWYVNHQERFLRSTNVGSFPRAELDQLPAPLWPRNFTSSSVSNHDVQLMAAYPNPFVEGIYLQYHVTGGEPIQFTLNSMDGKELYQFTSSSSEKGIRSIYLPLDVPSGMYIMTLIQGGKKQSSIRLIKP
jgi:alkaline phosphatase D